jgi:hypothetical protein
MSSSLTFRNCRTLMIYNPAFRDAVLSWTSYSADELISWDQRFFLRRLVDRVYRCGANPN